MIPVPQFRCGRSDLDEGKVKEWQVVSVGTEDDVLRFYSLRLKDDEVGCHRGWRFCLKSASNHVPCFHIWMI